LEFLRHLKEGGRGIALVLLLILGAVLLLVAGSDKKEVSINDRVPDAETKQKMEKELEDMICSMEGITLAKVSLILDGGNRYVWEEGKNTTVLAGRVRGVAVVCTGGNDPVIKERVINMLCALLDLPMKSVSVCQ